MKALVLLAIFDLVQWSLSDDFIIQTPSGKVRGISKRYGTHDIFQFRNIPYAKPPIGDLRFRKPQPYGSWSGVREGAYFGPSCMQDMSYFESEDTLIRLENTNISEDCLSLNIYLPHQMSAAGQQNKSVMIWVHGGGFVSGQAEWYDPSALAINGDVIVVTINYRLGLFGFLSTEDEASAGNYGLWDQHLAFKWVKNNIASVGGNPNSVTIFGESAGGWSVGLQSLAVQNKGLFQRVIAQSGVGNSMGAVTNSGLYFATKYGILLGCLNSTNDNIDTKHLVSCMRRQSSNDLLSVQLSDTLLTDDRMIFTPDTVATVDGEFIVDSPKNILRNENSESFKMFQSIDFITGNCNMEGSLAISDLASKSTKLHFNISLGVPTSILCGYINRGLVHDLHLNTVQSKIVSSAVCSFYKSTNPIEQGRRIADLAGDIEFVIPAIESLVAHSDRNTRTKSYQYMFNRPSLVQFDSNTPQWSIGSEHASELFYLFGLNVSLPQDEQMLSQNMLKYWTNFAKTGDPNGDGLQHWPTFNNSGRLYLNLDTTISVKNHVFNDRVNFWTERVPNMLRAAASLPIAIGK